MSQTAITPTREEDYPEWYQQVIRAAELAEHSMVRGCMVIRPWGYALWERMQQDLDRRFKETGHENAYFPLFIPLSLLEKEAQHVEGFAKECAVVTHHRLEERDGKLIPSGELEEPLIVRPTSETIIGESYAKWVKSYRDLPLLINQWANVVRWEMRTRLFLRTTEFLWQEGHTVHASAEEAVEETLRMLDVYERFAEDFLAMPVIKGIKTREETFPGAVDTYSIEALMQDGKALQAGTSHFLGQNFAKASNIKFTTKEETESFAWTTSWGVSTRMIGALIMSHSDDNGLVLPPKVAPQHIVILPILRKNDDQSSVLKACEDLAAKLRSLNFAGESVRVKVDKRDTPHKNWEYIKKGVPLKIEIGPRDLEKNQLALQTRHTLAKEFLSVETFLAEVPQRLESMQNELFGAAKKRLLESTQSIATEEEFRANFAGEKSGFVFAYAKDDPSVSVAIKALKVTARCIPDPTDLGVCIFTGEKGVPKTLFAKAY
jgi:prolyl-tRNA synthetase